MDHETDVGTKRECSVCLYDLHLSFVACSCSPNRYACLRHVKELCSCGWSAKQFFCRYETAEMRVLVEALEGNLKAVHSWAKRKDLPQSPSSRKSAAPALEECGGATCTSPPAPVMGLQNGVHGIGSTSLSCSGRKMFPGDNVVVLSDDDEG